MRSPCQRDLPKEILSGVRLTTIGALCFLVLLALLDGELRIGRAIIQRRATYGLAIGCVEAAVSAWLLWVTVRAWARWVTGVALFGALKGLPGLIAGTRVSIPFAPISRPVALEAIAYFVIGGLLALRFSTERPKKVEVVALVIFIFGAGADLLFEPAHLPFVVGIAAMIAAWAASVIGRPETEMRRNGRVPVTRHQ
jgi:hypothetical protein